MMRTLQVCYSFPPDPLGGTEVYVRALCLALESRGIEALVAAPGTVDETYEIDGLLVRRFKHGQTHDLAAIYSGDPAAAARFGELLDEERPDLVHQHALSPACSPRLASEAKKRGIPVVFTYHTPAASCLRGTLLEYGKVPCDGRLEIARCASCNLDAHGVPVWPARMLAMVPSVGGEVLAALNQQGGAWTALRMSNLTRQYVASLTAFWSHVDRIVVLTPWIERVLTVNGVPAHKLLHSAHGLPASEIPALADRRVSSRLRLVHLGRLDPVKGTGLLIRALRLVPDAAIDLDIYGIAQHERDHSLRQQLQALADRDTRMRFLPPLPHGEVISSLRQYDALIVPSQWMETGPLVVLEAFAAGVPVVASALGGLADKVHDGVDGLLVQPFDSIDAWRATLDRLSRNPKLLATLAAGIHPVRSMREVADDMAALYGTLVQGLDNKAVSRQPHEVVA